MKDDEKIKIEKAEVIPLSYGTDDEPPRRRYFALLKITTNNGITGWGEATDCYGHSHPMTVKALFEEHLKWLIIDQNPLKLEKLIGEIRRIAHQQLGGRGEIVTQLISGIEIALWDIRGKHMNKPIAELLGPYRDKIKLYAACSPAFHISPEQYAEISQNLRDHGVKAVKIRTGQELDWDKKFILSLRKLFNDDIKILVDGKFNYKIESAIKLAKVLEEINAICFEEPIADTNLSEISRLANSTSVPLAYGEHCFTIHDFRDLIVSNSARILTPDACANGGISEVRNVSILAHAFGLSIMPHCGGLTAIGLAANLHAAAAMPNFDLFEFDARSFQPLRDELPTKPIFLVENIVEGCMPVPKGPGLGVEVNESIFEKYPYHLDEKIARTFPLYGTPHI